MSKHNAAATSFSFGHDYNEQSLNTLSCLTRVRLPKVLKVFCLLLVAGITSTVAALWMPWVQTTTGMGRVTTLKPADRVQTINATLTGRIGQWYVQDADLVSAGDPIVLIQDLDTALPERLQTQLEASRSKLDAAREAVETAGIDYDRQRQLYEEGLASRYNYEQAGIRVRELRVSLAEAQTQFTQAEVNLSRQGSQLITAPRDGVITRVEAGDVATIVTAGQALASFMPANIQRAVEVFIDGRDIGLVHPGRQVRLEFEGWPAFQFSGMPGISVGTFPGTVSFIDPAAGMDGRFRVLVEEPAGLEDCGQGDKPTDARKCSWPPETYVRLGANVQGWILLETVPLGYELWRRLNNFPPINNATGSTNGQNQY